MGIDYWILKYPKFISHTEKQRLKNLAQRLLFEIKCLKTKTKTQNLEIYMEFSLKIGLLSFFFFFPFFLQGYIEMKMKIKE